MTFFEELKRRHVFRVGIAYLAFAWLLIEIAGTLFPGFGIPPWAFRFVVILLALGFFPTLVFSWAYELTPDGLKREKDVVRDPASAKVTARRLDWITIALVITAFAFIIVDRLLLQEEPGVTAPATEVAATTARDTQGVGRNSIAVLPFANRSANPDDVYFVDGIHDDLLTSISQIGSIKTISRTSVMQYRDSTMPIPQIATELGVGTILEGGVQRAGNQVRINVQLIDAATDDHLWSRIYDRELTASNIFAIQTEIAGEIAEALRETLTPQTRQRIDSVPTENLDALEAYFVGRQSMVVRTGESLDKARTYFEEAVSLDPGFALAWVGLSNATRLAYSYGGDIELEEAISISLTAAETAFELDSTLGEVHIAIANHKRWMAQYDEAEAAYRRGIELNPNYASAYQWYGEMLGLYLGGPGMTGRMAEALELSRKAVELDPLSPIINNDYGEVLARAGRAEEALVNFQKAVDIEPGFAPGFLEIALLNQSVFGQIDAAAAAMQRHYELSPRAGAASWVAWSYLNLDDADQVEYWRKRAADHSDGDTVPDIAFESLIYRGEPEAALDLLRKAYNSDPRNPWVLELYSHLLIDEEKEEEAHGLFANAYPDLLSDNPPQPGETFRLVPTAALIQSLTGNPKAAERLVFHCLEFIASYPRMGYDGYGILDARLYAVLGDTPSALNALQEAVDAGWRDGWWYYLEHDPTLALLHGEPRFLEIRKIIEADMRTQRARRNEAP